jgi:hypothetical protein
VKIPKTIGGVADALYDTRQRRFAAAKKVDELKREEAALGVAALALLNKARLTSGKGKRGVVTKVPKIVPQVFDWARLYAYIKKAGAWDLLQRRVSDTAWADRVETKGPVPGVRPERIIKISCTKKGAR